MKNNLHFSYGNAKLPRTTVIFDLPAGHSCPFAKLCKSKADPVTGKLTDGPDTQFRCYAASVESLRTSVRKLRWHNFNIIKNKTRKQIAKILINQLPPGFLYRLHSSGDFFSQSYFEAWIDVARAFPIRTFYAYTKAIPFWIAFKEEIPENFKLIASIGGTHDKYIYEYNLRFAKVVYSEKEAAKLDLEIDHDDSIAWNTNESFALLLHGTQPAKTDAARAWQKIKITVGGYSLKPQKKISFQINKL